MITTTTISLNEARRRTENWKVFLESTYASLNPRYLSKGVFISKEDIFALAEMCNTLPDAMGARAYFTITDMHRELAEKNNVTVLMVPVVKSSNPGGSDVVSTGLTSDGDDDDTTIYDFTKPCPDYCDPDSPIFGL